MSTYGSTGTHPAHAKTPIHIGYVIASSLVCAAGLTLLFVFLINLSLAMADVLLIPGSALLAVGFLMLTRKRAGLDGAAP